MCARVSYNDLKNYYKKGNYYYNNKDYDEAIFYFKKILKFDQNFKDTEKKLSNCFYEKERITKNSLKKSRQKEKKLKQKEKKRLRIIAQNTQLHYAEKIKLLEQIDNELITNEAQLENSIKMKVYDGKWSTLLERKKELRKIVDNADLDISSKRNLKIKINKKFIVDEELLKEQIDNEKKIEEIKEKLKKIVDKTDLNHFSKRNLKIKINKNLIVNEYELNKQIITEKKSERKEKLRKIEEEEKKKKTLKKTPKKQKEEMNAEKSKPKYYNIGYNTDYSDIDTSYGSRYWHDLYH